MEGWTIREIRAETMIYASLSSLVAVIHDAEQTSPKFSIMVRNASIQDKEGETRYRIYTVMDMPWPLDDRDMLTQREIRQNRDSRVVTITDLATRDIMPLKEDLVRIVDSRQQWILTPLSKKQTNAAAGGSQRADAIKPYQRHVGGPAYRHIENAQTTGVQANL